MEYGRHLGRGLAHAGRSLEALWPGSRFRDPLVTALQQEAPRSGAVLFCGNRGGAGVAELSSSRDVSWHLMGSCCCPWLGIQDSCAANYALPWEPAGAENRRGPASAPFPGAGGTGEARRAPAPGSEMKSHAVKFTANQTMQKPVRP